MKDDLARTPSLWESESAPLGALWLALTTAALFGAALRWAPAGTVFSVTALAAVTSLGLAGASGALRKPWLARTIGTRPSDWLVDVSVGLACGAALSGMTALLFSLLAAYLPWVHDGAVELYRLVYSDRSLFLQIPIVILVVAVEEIIWRGIVFGALGHVLKGAGLVVVTTLLYALPQLLGATWLLLLVAAGCGAFWTIQRSLGARLLLVFVTHLTWDLCIFYFFPLVETTAV